MTVNHSTSRVEEAQDTIQIFQGIINSDPFKIQKEKEVAIIIAVGMIATMEAYQGL